MGVQTAKTSRVLPEHKIGRECVVPLSLLDATTVKFAPTSAIWLLERPTVLVDSSRLQDHLRTTLSATLDAYPQFSGHLRAVLAIDGESLSPETTTFPPHARRYGRVYAHYGTNTDPGVEFVEATSSATVDLLYSTTSVKRRPVWNRQEVEDSLAQFAPPTSLAQALESSESPTNGPCGPSLAVQCTKLACGGLVLAAKMAHPLADITTLTCFVRDWSSVSRAVLMGDSPPVLKQLFEPKRLDACAAGDINAHNPDPTILKAALSLPLHRYDWWAPPAAPPSPFPTDLSLAGKPLPWDEWDAKASVDKYTIHFTREQVNNLWQLATREGLHTSSKHKISKHDALLAHIWSCVVRSRALQDDLESVHCDLVLGTRPAFKLGDSFIGSPTMMINIEMTASEVASSTALGRIAQQVRETLSTVNNPQQLAAHLHSIAYEKSPQRIWQAFLGRRHILVTTWARARLYDIDFGLGSSIRYADGIVPCLDGCILISEGPPPHAAALSDTTSRDWTSNGVDVTLPLRCEDMVRLLRDPLLLPQV